MLLINRVTQSVGKHVCRPHFHHSVGLIGARNVKRVRITAGFEVSMTNVLYPSVAEL